MKPLRTQPYFKYAIEHLPADSRIDKAVAEYLGMRLHKDPHLHPKVWEACIDEFVEGMGIDVNTKEPKPRKRVIGKKKDTHTIDDIVYLFNVATSREWNHVYFTRQQDADYSNISFYQDPYWSKIKKDPKIRKELEESLNGTDN